MITGYYPTACGLFRCHNYCQLYVPSVYFGVLGRLHQGTVKFASHEVADDVSPLAQGARLIGPWPSPWLCLRAFCWAQRPTRSFARHMAASFFIYSCLTPTSNKALTQPRDLHQLSYHQAQLCKVAHNFRHWLQLVPTEMQLQAPLDVFAREP